MEREVTDKNLASRRLLTPCIAIDSEVPLRTLQRNALRQYFERRNFTPQDVAALGCRCIKGIPGIGSKGIENIRLWLGSFGLKLHDTPPAENSARTEKIKLKIERAIRLLRAHGYTVQGRIRKRRPGL